MYVLFLFLNFKLHFSYVNVYTFGHTNIPKISRIPDLLTKFAQKKMSNFRGMALTVIYSTKELWVPKPCGTVLIFLLVDGGFGDWSNFGLCSKTCGKGKQQRSRSCNNPAPAHGGQSCNGEDSQSRDCMLKECPSMIYFVTSLFFIWLKNYTLEYYQVLMNLIPNP